MGTTGEFKGAEILHDAPQTARSGRAIESKPALNFNSVNEAARKAGLEPKLTSASSPQEVIAYADVIGTKANAILKTLGRR